MKELEDLKEQFEQISKSIEEELENDTGFKEYFKDQLEEVVKDEIEGLTGNVGTIMEKFQDDLTMYTTDSGKSFERMEAVLETSDKRLDDLIISTEKMTEGAAKIPASVAAIKDQLKGQLAEIVKAEFKLYTQALEKLNKGFQSELCKQIKDLNAKDLKPIMDSLEELEKSSTKNGTMLIINATVLAGIAISFAVATVVYFWG